MSSENFDLNSFYNKRKDIIKKNIDENLGLEFKENIFDATDVSASLAVGSAKGLSYLLDLPAMISDAGSFLVEKAMSPVNNLIKRKVFGKSEEEIEEENKLASEIRAKSKIKPPGQFIREKFLTYEPKTVAGDYAETIGEYAAPGGILGKGAKAKSILLGTGAVSGATGEAVEKFTGNETLGTLTALGLNIPLDIFALSRGNVGTISKNLLPKDKVIKDAQKLQDWAKSRNIILTSGEATNKANLIATEGNIRTSLQGSKIMDDFYESRPEQIKIFIKDFAKEIGLITDSSKLSRSMILNAEKKASIALQANRSKLWLKAGGGKFNDTFFNQVDVDNIIAKIAKLKTLPQNKKFSTLLDDYAQQLKVSDAKGKNLHDIYKDLQDNILSISKNPNKTSLLIKEKKLLTSIKDDLDSLLRSNSDFAKAQKKYVQFTNAYVKPIDKTKLFKDISVAGWVDDADVVGRVYRYLGSDKISPRDIEKLANSFQKAGNYEKWRLIVSGYFDEAFTKALSNNMGEGLNLGSVFHKALVGSPKARANFTEMMWQLARQRGNKITKSDMAKAIDSFAAVLKATGRNAKAGSPTAQRTKQMSDLEKNLAGNIMEGIPVYTWFKNLFNERTLSKNSELFATALTSEKGIAAFVDLAQNWKDPSKAIATLKIISLGGGNIIDSNEEVE